MRYVLLGGILLTACSGISLQADTRPEIPLGLDLYMPIPTDDPLTRQKLSLGRRLFSDTILSNDRRLACITCHDPERAYADGRRVAVGSFGRTGTRNVPTIINRAYGSKFFWDGRISNLEIQVLQPIRDPKEMDLSLADAVDRLRRHPDYPTLFHAAFNQEPNSDDLGRALASYVRTILSGDSLFDRYINGEQDALSEQALEGLRIFRGKGNCSACHVAPTFTDERLHNTGVAFQGGRWLDQGRYLVTGNEEDRGAFKTPTLREVARTAPYMHDGSLSTLEDVIAYYDRGGNRNPYLDRELQSLKLEDAEKQALITFLRSLSGRIQEGI
jgi:cytochrome c peroxidase